MCTAKSPEIPRIIRDSYDKDFGPISDTFDDFDSEPYVRIRSYSTGSRPVGIHFGDENKTSLRTNSIVDIFKSYLVSRSPETSRPQTPINTELQIEGTSTSSLQIPVLEKHLSRSTGDINQKSYDAKLSDTNSLFPDLEVKIAALAIASQKANAKQTQPAHQQCQTAKIAEILQVPNIELKQSMTETTQQISEPEVKSMVSSALSPSNKRKRPFHRDMNVLAPTSW